MFPYIQIELDRANMEISEKRYLAMCFTATLFLFVFLTAALTLFFAKFGKIYLGPIFAIIASISVLILQINYPRLSSYRRIRKLDADLLAALSAIMVQLNSGVPIFEAMVILSKQEFGEISKEFSKTVKKINAGTPQIEALESMALKNPSPYFRRAITQLINGMKEGADINQVIDTTISNLTKEQIIQIEKYGSQLNPLITFYMMGAVIFPALAITFFIAIVSFIGLEGVLVQLIFWGLLALVTFFQLMFGGIIKTKRPGLLGE
ncbi:MAG: type II secretion system F family protein [Nanoarchaeota archaeon]|nr:type II secretion system F family protein [Nanoarchaeota archaeon]